ncbi:MAG: arginyltransferase [Gammaproteobacteria bacterium]|nr:arginyltransferase [Gammaproteobacteria bacterium]
MQKTQQILLYASHPEPCNYLPEESCINRFIDPNLDMNQRLYSQLVAQGFRRSGNMVYQPYCDECQACLPARIPVNQFQPNRSQRRNQKSNQDISVTVKNSDFCEEHFQLYARYLNSRHGDGSMANPTSESYQQFLITDWGETLFVEFRLGERLLAVAVTDQLNNGLSAVYTFFDPEEGKRALGKFAILWQIQHARRLGLEHLYLGYWIKECRKMSYKGDYQPVEIFQQKQWQIA